jgi:hypothetical protein
LVFSVFDAIKDLKLYKGGIPANFEVAFLLFWTFTKKTEQQRIPMNGGIGLISSRLLLEGPLVKTKVRFYRGRSSYGHLFLNFLSKNNSVYFYDLNAKLSYKLDPNNNLFLSGYFGRDVFS